jgi:hypothetical protein
VALFGRPSGRKVVKQLIDRCERGEELRLHTYPTKSLAEAYSLLVAIDEGDAIPHNDDRGYFSLFRLMSNIETEMSKRGE